VYNVDQPLINVISL